MPNSLPLCIRSNHNAQNNLKDIVGLIFDLQEFVNTIFKCIEIELYSTRIVPSMLLGKMFDTIRYNSPKYKVSKNWQKPKCQSLL